jgi:Holliday junction resolvasome RuvABC DNA-binding subunit
MLQMTDHKVIAGIEDIGEKVVERLIIDLKKSEKEASELLFSSGTFAKLSDYNTRFFAKPWREIYEMLKKELKV